MMHRWCLSENTRRKKQTGKPVCTKNHQLRPGQSISKEPSSHVDIGHFVLFYKFDLPPEISTMCIIPLVWHYSGCCLNSDARLFVILYHWFSLVHMNCDRDVSHVECSNSDLTSATSISCIEISAGFIYAVFYALLHLIL